jgi:hypothetical protein
MAPAFLLALFLMPKTLWSLRRNNDTRYSLLRRLDLPGLLFITGGLLMFILGLTEGAALG